MLAIVAKAKDPPASVIEVYLDLQISTWHCLWLFGFR